MEESSLSSSSLSSNSSINSSRKKKITKRVRIRAPPPPNFHRCLFCLGTCTLSSFSNTGKIKEEDSEERGTSLNIPGAGTSVHLSRHLEQMFILRKLLELPFSWCEETLQERTTKVLEGQDKQKDGPGHDKDGYIGDLNQWFNLCVKCSQKWVQPGWEIYQKIIGLEQQLNLIRVSVKDTMMTRILQNKRNRKWSGFKGNGMDVQIRKWMFPGKKIIK